jgi:hypothetical protein
MTFVPGDTNPLHPDIKRQQTIDGKQDMMYFSKVPIINVISPAGYDISTMLISKDV